MTTNDLSQCKNCIYHYTYNGKDMCKPVVDDFYLQWKIEDCPYHTTITSATKISDEIYRLRAENTMLHERVTKAEHAAMISERALKDCIDYYSYSGLCPVLDCNYNKACWRKECTPDIEKCFMVQAEKELAELKGE